MFCILPEQKNFYQEKGRIFFIYTDACIKKYECVIIKVIELYDDCIILFTCIVCVILSNNLF